MSVPQRFRYFGNILKALDIHSTKSYKFSRVFKKCYPYLDYLSLIVGVPLISTRDKHGRAGIFNPCLNKMMSDIREEELFPDF